MNIKHAPGETYGGNIKYAPRGNLRREHQARPHRHHVNIKYAPGQPTAGTSSSLLGAAYGENIEYTARGNPRCEHQVRPPGGTYGVNIEYALRVTT